jgi:hypothetical protein
MQNCHRCPETSHIDELAIRNDFEHMFDYATAQ